MADELHRRPRPKRKSRLHCLESPFPVPIETITGKLSDDTRWYYYFGDLQADHVSVKRLGDLTFLYRLGFYGKGVLSKGRPQYNKYGEALSTDTRKQYMYSLRNLEPDKREQKMVEFDSIQTERLRLHQEWAVKGNLQANQPVESESSVVKETTIRKSEANHHELDTQLDQCLDLHTYIDDGHVEEYSTDGDEDEVEEETKEHTLDGECSDNVLKQDIGEISSSITENNDSVNSTDEGSSEKNSAKNDSRCQVSNLKSNENNHLSTSTKSEPRTSQSHLISIDSFSVESIDDVEQDTSQRLDLKRAAEETDKNCAESKKMKLCDDYPMAEFLCLSFEEAFFLSFGLGCLTVKSEDKPMKIIDMWQTFCSRHKTFPEMYTVYHYLRSKGWVVRSGSLFGADFVLYKDGMPFFHASHCVYVHLIDEESLSSPEFSATWQWKYLSCINRVHERIAKDTLFCFVVKPKDFADDELSSPRCLRRLRVMEFMIRRWVPKKTRDMAK